MAVRAARVTIHDAVFPEREHNRRAAEFFRYGGKQFVSASDRHFRDIGGFHFIYEKAVDIVQRQIENAFFERRRIEKNHESAFMRFFDDVIEHIDFILQNNKIAF